MEKASVYTGWNISPDLSDQRDRQGQFIWFRQLYLYSHLFFQLLKALLLVYLHPHMSEVLTLSVRGCFCTYAKVSSLRD